MHNHVDHDQAVAELTEIATTLINDPIFGPRPTLRTDLLGRAAAGDHEAWRRHPETHPFSEAIVQLLVDAGADRDVLAATAAETGARLDAYLSGLDTYGR